MKEQQQNKAKHKNIFIVVNEMRINNKFQIFYRNGKQPFFPLSFKEPEQQ